MKYGEGVMGAPRASKIKIGVFDSGVGGLSVTKAIQEALPNYEVIYATDKVHIPYGTKSPKELYGYVLPILKELENRGCKVIVIACNTVTTTIIGTLRKHLKVPLIGMEPMVKPAADMTRTGIIAVCATPTTLASKRYAWLKDNFAKGIQVLEPDSRDWSKLIESNQIHKRHIVEQIEGVCRAGADVIVLGCTHYHWIENEIIKIANRRAIVLQPEKPVIERLTQVLQQLA